MGRNAAWLSEKQVEVLEWIKDGCPSSALEDDSGRRITARALQRRGLVTIKGQGTSWTASITETGLAWRASHPEAKLGGAQVDELIQRVLAADGRLELPEGRDVETTHKELVRMSDHSPARPTGWRLEMRSTGPWSDRRQEDVGRAVQVRLAHRLPVMVRKERLHRLVVSRHVSQGRARAGPRRVRRSA